MPATRNFFQSVPFVRITISALCGILIQHQLNIDSSWIAALSVIVVSALILFWDNNQFSVLRFLNLALPLATLLLGMLVATANPDKMPEIPSDRNYFLAEVIQKPAEKENTFQGILEVSNPAYPKPIKVVAYFAKPGFDTTLNIGDQIIILGQLQKIRNMGNPFEFDYRAMMKRRGITTSVYLAPASYMKTGISHKRLRYVPEKLREKAIGILKNSSIEKQNLGLIEALTLGYRAELDQETINRFASTGTTHVLAVSGLHVGLIYYILGLILKSIKRLKNGRFLFPFIVIALLWGYAFLTGFSASVQRATVMFTFVIVGESIRRPVNIYNSLAASALLLMLIDADVVYEVGFQLSYLAVFGIVLIQPRLSSLLEVKNKILNFFWELLTVSIAAQLITFPLCLFYFNQFPNFFWLSNLTVIPLSTILMWLAFGYFLIFTIPFISTVFATLINWTTSFMLWTLKVVSELPHALSEGIVVSPVQTLILYLIIISLIAFWFSKQKFWLFSIAVLGIVFQSDILYSNLKLANQRSIVVYNSKNTLVHLINGRTSYVITLNSDSLAEQDLKTIENVSNHLKLAGTQFINLAKTNRLNENDLIIDRGKVFFLNTGISFQQDQFRKKTQINITTGNLDGKLRSYLVSGGSGSEKDIYYTGKAGAFVLNPENPPETKPNEIAYSN